MPIDFTPRLKCITDSDVTPRRFHPHFLHPAAALGKYER
jgi:hypothetical protein